MMGANSMMIGGYLTQRGRSVEEDQTARQGDTLRMDEMRRFLDERAREHTLRSLSALESASARKGDAGRRRVRRFLVKRLPRLLRASCARAGGG